ncbi:MAG: ferrous iron transport protein B [Anaerolineales bacterium]|nr:ferrous iron transport protein B [Anaerolineales bacterium]
MADLTIALAGNPNAGKTTIFNALTGLRQHTGNWPGKTVEKKEGEIEHEGKTINIVDLPGTYSLTAYSPEEIIARDFIIEERPDVVVNVVDATNLERNLYLTLQLLELEVPVVLALNMTDELQKDGAKINVERLSQLLGNIPVVQTAANKGKGISELINQAVQAAKKLHHLPLFQFDYGGKIEREIAKLIAAFDETDYDSRPYPKRWLALKLLEADEAIFARVSKTPNGERIIALAQQGATHLKDMLGDDTDLLTADRRYGYINGVVRQSLQRPLVNRLTLTDRVDDIVTHKWLGLPVFFAVMYIVFRLVIDVSSPFLDWMDAVVNGPIARWLRFLLDLVSAPAWTRSLVIDGIVAGVGGVLVFVPGLLMLYFFLALLEDSGYMSRAAFVMDRFMRVVGLHGKSFIPMILGFGCAVPAIYATRTIPSRRDRVLTALLVPLMSCSARLPVYVVFGLAFFGARAGTVIWGMYALGIIVAMLAGMVFTRTILKPDVTSAFVLELPPYRQPALKSVLIHMWENTREFVRKAGTTILLASIVMWTLLNLPWGVSDQRASYFGKVSGAISPVFVPLGFGNWETGGALVSGFMAKEIVVSTLSQVYVGGEDEPMETATTFGEDLLGIGQGFVEAAVSSGKILVSILPGVNLTDEAAEGEDTALSIALRERFTPLSAVSLLVFVLLYVPCVATLGAIKHEFGASWAVTSAVYQTVAAWLAALLVYQGGRLLGLG